MGDGIATNFASTDLHRAIARFVDSLDDLPRRLSSRYLDSTTDAFAEDALYSVTGSDAGV